ncbi:MAG: ribonuclease P protein component [Rhodanobacteraceae bacterium]|nr:MAG: ribonuclease P protein component [Rhodanobacteraceae bacterium]
MAGLPPSARLRRAADFAALRNATGRWQGRHFALRWIASLQACPRLGMAVSRKVSKRAVMRNRIKRVIRETFRARYDRLPALDILVIARSSAAASDNQALREELDRAWRQLQALKQAAAPGTIGG